MNLEFDLLIFYNLYLGLFHLLRDWNSPTVPSHTLHIAFDTIRDKQCFPIRATKGTVRQVLSTFWRCYNPGLGNSVRIHDKH